MACNASTFCAALACGRDSTAVKPVSEAIDSVRVTGRTGSRSSPLVSAELLALCPKEAGSRRGCGRAAAAAWGPEPVRTGSGPVSSVMSMMTGALPFGAVEEEEGWEAGWKANVVRSMVGAEVPLKEEGSRRRFIRPDEPDCATTRGNKKRQLEVSSRGPIDR